MRLNRVCVARNDRAKLAELFGKMLNLHGKLEQERRAKSCKIQLRRYFRFISVTVLQHRSSRSEVETRVNRKTG